MELGGGWVGGGLGLTTRVQRRVGERRGFAFFALLLSLPAWGKWEREWKSTGAALLTGNLLLFCGGFGLAEILELFFSFFISRTPLCVCAGSYLLHGCSVDVEIMDFLCGLGLKDFSEELI